MENREILVANTRTQKRDKITTNATTLGELKDALTEAGIDYSGMTFTEGISKTQLLDDATQLPQNVIYKGQPTNHLVILLTNTKKNIASGTMDRKEAYSAIQKNSLQEAIKKEFGRNFTQVSTSDLVDFILQHTAKKEELSEEDFEEKDSEKETEESSFPKDPVEWAKSLTLESSIFLIVLKLADRGLLTSDDIQTLKHKLGALQDELEGIEAEEREPVSTSDGKITDDDIDDMIIDLNA